MTKLPISIIFLIFSISGHASSIVETATEEQLRSATCALSEMPSKAKNILLNATRIYLKKKDGVELVKAFQMDEVPYFLTKCFQVHATMTMQQRTSKRNFAHFYDASERYMRFLLLVDVAKAGGADLATIKELKQNAYAQITKLNLEYY
ncbi:MAG: hypothetical protein IME93_05600 [Proteobacteria bacterium]|nr:hypothetical protein [Pseudomonadota bacterium]